jgi:hypothetical protein
MKAILGLGWAKKKNFSEGLAFFLLHPTNSQSSFASKTCFRAYASFVFVKTGYRFFETSRRSDDYSTNLVDHSKYDFFLFDGVFCN